MRSPDASKLARLIKEARAFRDSQSAKERRQVAKHLVNALVSLRQAERALAMTEGIERQGVPDGDDS